MVILSKISKAVADKLLEDQGYRRSVLDNWQPIWNFYLGNLEASQLNRAQVLDVFPSETCLTFILVAPFLSVAMPFT